MQKLQILRNNDILCVGEVRAWVNKSRDNAHVFPREFVPEYSFIELLIEQ